jgi:hypothetical protein
MSWTVLFLRPAPLKRIEGITRNLSSDGLYCVISAPLAIGQVIGYVLTIPAVDTGRRGDPVRLQGEAEVLRVDILGPRRYGIACRVRDYRVLHLDHSSDDPVSS